MAQANRKTQSKILEIEDSGLELVRKEKRTGKRATNRDYASLDFKPWLPEADGRLVPSPEAWGAIGASCRLAYGIMLKDRETLIAIHSKLDHEHVDALMADLANASERLKEMVQMVEGAYTRVLASACAAEARGVEFAGVN